MPRDKVAQLHRLRARVRRLEEELYEPHCFVCGQWVNVCCNETVWTCPCNDGGALVCEECWPAHEREHHP